MTKFYLMQKTCTTDYQHHDGEIAKERNIKPYYYRHYMLVESRGQIENIGEIIETDSLDDLIEKYKTILKENQIVHNVHPCFPKYPEYIDIQGDIEVYDTIGNEEIKKLESAGISFTPN